MSTKMGSYHKISLAVAAAAVAVAYGASAAEPLTEVIVEAPKVVHSAQRSPTGAPIDIASVRYRVSYADLNLATHSGAVTLEQRITDAAKQACKQLESATGPGAFPVSGDPPCIKTATDGAMKQAHEAIAAAEAKAKK